jgi:hypothetical protein
MYCITDRQIDFILTDIRARGVELEDLQLNLLDHVCCIIEQQLEENGDFGKFYTTTIRKFYKDELREIEEETQSLLTNKNYYVMKKIMIFSGIFSAAVLTTGIVLKYMVSPGAAVMITMGIVSASLIFIPLLFALKIKEKQSPKDKLLVGLGTLSAITIALAILFRIMHWPGANVLGIISPAVLALLFLPIYLFSGLSDPDRKVNTIVTSILIVVGIGLFFTLTITPHSSHLMIVRNTKDYLRNEQILANEQRLLDKYWKADSAKVQTNELGKKVYTACEDLKNSILESEVNKQIEEKQVGTDFKGTNFYIKDHAASDFFDNNAAASVKLNELRKTIAAYNTDAKTINPTLDLIPVDANVVDANNIATGYKIISVMNDIIQIQMLVLQNERALAAL